MMMSAGEVFNILNYGAVPDGRTPATQAFTAAIGACSRSGGGVVYVPSGQFLTGPIVMQSNLVLYLEAGAHVLFSQEREDYPVIQSRWEGEVCPVYTPQIYGKGLRNVALVGRGVLDGRGEYWWRVYRNQALDYPRPRLISLEDCTDLLIEGVRLRNSPSWTVHPIRCQNVVIDGITIESPPDSPNTDGIDPDSCQNVHISNCHIDVGDDCIALKSGNERCTPRSSCENIVISNCTMVRGHGGVVIGSEMSGGVRDVVIDNCIFEGTDRGIRLKTRRGRGGVVEDIRVNNVIMRRVVAPFVLHMFYNCGAGGKEAGVRDKNPYPVTEATPVLRRVYFSNITVREAGAAAGFIYGLPEMPVAEITFDNIAVEMACDSEPAFPAMMDGLEPMRQKGFYCCNVRNVAFRNVTINGCEGADFEVRQAEQIEFAGCQMDQTDPSQPLVVLKKVNGALIRGFDVPETRQIFIELSGAETRDIRIFGNAARLCEKNIKLSDGADRNSLNLI